MLNKSAIEQYFLAEKNAGLLFLIIGLISIALAIVFYFLLKTEFCKGVAYVLVITGLVQAGVGYVVYSRSDKQRVDNVYAFDMDPGKLKTKEVPRMQKAVSGIQLFLGIEIVLLMAGIVFYFKNKSPQQGLYSVWAGVGIALIIQALILAGADYFAYKRGKAYLDDLSTFTGVK
ncbi:MAG: hypothetical protein ACTHLE_10875 [Agriterribacter sp.]